MREVNAGPRNARWRWGGGDGEWRGDRRGRARRYSSDGDCAMALVAVWPADDQAWSRSRRATPRRGSMEQRRMGWRGRVARRARRRLAKRCEVLRRGDSGPALPVEYGPTGMSSSDVSDALNAAVLDDGRAVRN